MNADTRPGLASPEGQEERSRLAAPDVEPHLERQRAGALEEARQEFKSQAERVSSGDLEIRAFVLITTLRY